MAQAEATLEGWQRPGLFRQPLPILVHHYCLWCAFWFPCVDFRKLVRAHVDLAANLNQRRHWILIGAAQLVRDIRNHLGIGGDVFSHAAVATRCRGGQLAIPIDQVDGQAINLQLRQVRLRRENRELKRANGILKTASAFFAAELDRATTK